MVRLTLILMGHGEGPVAAEMGAGLISGAAGHLLLLMLPSPVRALTLQTSRGSAPPLLQLFLNGAAPEELFIFPWSGQNRSVLCCGFFPSEI